MYGSVSRAKQHSSWGEVLILITQISWAHKSQCRHVWQPYMEDSMHSTTSFHTCLNLMGKAWWAWSTWDRQGLIGKSVGSRRAKSTWGIYMYGGDRGQMGNKAMVTRGIPGGIIDLDVASIIRSRSLCSWVTCQAMTPVPNAPPCLPSVNKALEKYCPSLYTKPFVGWSASKNIPFLPHLTTLPWKTGRDWMQ